MAVFSFLLHAGYSPQPAISHAELPCILNYFCGALHFLASLYPTYLCSFGHIPVCSEQIALRCPHELLGLSRGSGSPHIALLIGHSDNYGFASPCLLQATSRPALQPLPHLHLSIDAAT